MKLNGLKLPMKELTSCVGLGIRPPPAPPRKGTFCITQPAIEKGSNPIGRMPAPRLAVGVPVGKTQFRIPVGSIIEPPMMQLVILVGSKPAGSTPPVRLAALGRPLGNTQLRMPL